MSANARVVLLVEDDTTLYTMVYNRTNEKIGSCITKIGEPFGVRFRFENFWGTDVGRCEGRAFVGRQDYVHAYQRKDRLSHY
jgi:hypothetical protein